MALFADVLDHMEWKTGFRSDGLAMSVYNIIAVAMVGICTGIFNGMDCRGRVCGGIQQGAWRRLPVISLYRTIQGTGWRYLIRRSQCLHAHAAASFCITLLYIQFPGMIPRNGRLDPLHGIEQIADGSIMVQGIDNIGDIFAHITVDIPFSGKKFRRLVHQIGG